MKSPTPIDVVETIYSALWAEGEDVWLQQTLAAIAECVGCEFGAVAWRYDFAGVVERWQMLPPLVYRASEDLAQAIHGCFLECPPEYRAFTHRKLGPASSFSAATNTELTQIPSAFGAAEARRLGIADQILLNAANPDDTGLVFGINRRQRAKLHAQQRRRFSLLVAHAAAALRLRNNARVADPDVVFEANGKVAHASMSGQRELAGLRAAWLRVSRMRGASQRLRSDDAIEAWHALVRGRYSLVDRFDSDGRRYTVALENAPGVKDPRGLTSAEAAIAEWAHRGHSDKLIAYEMGISAGTVSGMLGRVFKKLAVYSRTELIERLALPQEAERVSLTDGAEAIVFARADLTATPELNELTPAELNVVAGVAAGLSNAAVAARHGKSRRTVAHQLASAYRKLGVGSRAELSARFGAAFRAATANVTAPLSAR